MADDEIPLTTFPMEVLADFNIDAADIAAKLNRQQVLQLIKELDDAVGSWPVTLLLANHFQTEAGRARSEGLVSAKMALMTTDELTLHILERDAQDAIEAQKEGM